MNMGFLDLFVLWLILSAVCWASPLFTHRWRTPLALWIILTVLYWAIPVAGWVATRNLPH